MSGGEGAYVSSTLSFSLSLSLSSLLLYTHGYSMMSINAPRDRMTTSGNVILYVEVGPCLTEHAVLMC